MAELTYYAAMRQNLLLIFIMFFTLTSCEFTSPFTEVSKKRLAKKSAGIDGLKVPFKRLSDLMESIHHHHIIPTNNNEVPENVALLFGIYPSKDGDFYRGQCSSFLVAPNVLATNAHCIPEDIRKKGGNCKDRLVALFADNEFVNCKKVLSVTDLNNHTYLHNQDFAMILLEKNLNREPIKVSPLGVGESEPLLALAFNPSDLTSEESLFEIKKCQVVSGSILNRQFVSPSGRNILLSNCDIISGNSGSAIINHGGFVVGIAQGTYLYNKEEILNQIKNKEGLELEEMGSLGLGTNLSCVDLPAPYDHYPKGRECSLTPEEATPYHKKTFEKIRQKNINEAITAIDNPVFKYSLQKMVGNSVVAIPRCIKDIVAFNDQIKADGENGSTVDLYTFSIEDHYDDRLVFSPQIILKERTPKEATFKLDGAKFLMTIEDNNQVIAEREISICR